MPLNLTVLHQGWIRPLVFKAIFPLVWNKNTIWWVLGLISTAELAILPFWFCWWKRLKPAELVQSMPNLQRQGVKKELTGELHPYEPCCLFSRGCTLYRLSCLLFVEWWSWAPQRIRATMLFLKLLSYSCSSVCETSLLISARKRSRAWTSSPSHHLKRRPLP